MTGYNKNFFGYKFCLASRISKNSTHDLYINYQKNLKKGLIISLLIIITLFKLFPKFQNDSNHTKTDITKIEVINIPIIKEIQPPPPLPKAIKLNKPVVVKTKKTDKSKVNTLKDEIKKTELKLTLDNKGKDFLVTNTQFDDISSVNFQLRSLDRSTISPLEIDSDASSFTLDNDVNLSLNKMTTKRVNNRLSETIELENDLLNDKRKKKVETPKTTNTDIKQVISINKNQFILKESESTIGTNEYKTWNRINASLDRLNKDRYGDLPPNVKRVNLGLTIVFSYKNGSKHDIFWKKGGNLIIRVTNTKFVNQLDELKKAYKALFQLIYNLDT